MLADVNGIRMCYEDRGEGEPVVLIGGFGANRLFWDDAVSMMDGYRAITYDNRGVGDTEYSGGFSIDDLADDVVALLDHLGIDRAHAVGWSMGSQIGQSLGIRHADRLKSLTLVSAFLRFPSRSYYVLKGFNDLALNGDAPMACLAMAVNAFCFPEWMFRDMDDRGIAFPIPERLERPEGLRDQLDAIRGYDTTDAARGIKVPTLVVHGGEDLMVAPEEGRKVADAVEGSRFLLLGSAGHSIPFRECWTQLRAFIGSNA